MVANGPGSLLGILYTYIFQKYYENSMKKQYIATVSILIVVIFLAIIIPKPEVETVIGSCAVILVVILFSSPLAVIQTVLKEKNTSAMPFWTTIAIFINCILWALYATVLKYDPVKKYFLYNIINILYFFLMCWVFLLVVSRLVFL